MTVGSLPAVGDRPLCGATGFRDPTAFYRDGPASKGPCSSTLRRADRSSDKGAALAQSLRRAREAHRKLTRPAVIPDCVTALPWASRAIPSEVRPAMRELADRVGRLRSWFASPRPLFHVKRGSLSQKTNDRTRRRALPLSLAPQCRRALAPDSGYGINASLGISDCVRAALDPYPGSPAARPRGVPDVPKSLAIFHASKLAVSPPGKRATAPTDIMSDSLISGSGVAAALAKH